MTCSRCGAAYLPADPECPRCGLPLTPSVSAAPPAGPAPATAHRRSWLALGGGVLVALLVAVVALNSFGGNDSDGRSPLGAGAEPPAGGLRTEELPPVSLPTASSSATDGSTPAGTVAPGRNLAATASITADRTAPPGQDDQGRPVSYGTAHLADGDLTTAWRAPGYYNDESITFQLAGSSRIQILGLTNGYTKRDAASGADRYAAGRRITAVTWTFDNGIQVHQSLEDGVRTVQRLKIEPVQARTVTLTVDQTTTPGRFTSDFTAITEVLLQS
jgi:hypothetical protein